MSDSMLDGFKAVNHARRSVRGFLPEQIPEQDLQSIFEEAGRAPSNCNTQPWQVWVASGDKRDEIKTALTTSVMKGEMTPDYPWSGKYDGIYKERQHDAARQLYSAMEIARDDRAGRQGSFMRNYELFDAPHVCFLFIREDFGIRESADVGMYSQNLMLSIAAHGYASCPQTSLGFFAKQVREILGVSEEWKLLYGISFGKEDTSVKANNAVVGRAPLEELVTFTS